MNIRINKYISEAGVASRRDADRLIEAGKVRMNGRLAELGDVVGPGDKVLVNGNPVNYGIQRVYLAYNKPVGVTSTTDREDPDNIIKAVAYHGGRIFPIGRLDKDSEGLILLTNDGDVVNKILRVSNKHDKEYLVKVDQPITGDFLGKMASGVSILGVVTRKCTVEKINTNTFRIILNQGMNRQIRRMCKALGYKVLQLERVRIMNITVKGISTGTWRFLTDEEIDGLLGATESSSNVGTVSKSRSQVYKARPRKKAGKYEKNRETDSDRVKAPKQDKPAGSSGKPGKFATKKSRSGSTSPAHSKKDPSGKKTSTSGASLSTSGPRSKVKSTSSTASPKVSKASHTKTAKKTGSEATIIKYGKNRTDQKRSSVRSTRKK
jgi:23S rRNA pseudouridine2604 synthase